MSRSAIERAFGSLRRLLRRRRVPRASEQQWLRLILLVRRLQHDQIALGQRLEDVRSLPGVLGAMRTDFSALQAELIAARQSAEALEHGLSERLERFDGLLDASAQQSERERRLDALAERLETLAERTPDPHAGVLEPVLARLVDLASRLESKLEDERGVGQDELAQLETRIQILAEDAARRTHEEYGEEDDEEGEYDEDGDGSRGASRASAIGAGLTRLGDQLEQLEAAVLALGSNAVLPAQAEMIARLAQLAERGAGRGVSREELGAMLARLQDLVERLELAPAALPELPPDTITSPDAATAHQIEELRVSLLCEQESRRRVDGELEELRERLRASELARVELETRHTTELAQMADHVGRKLHRVEEDLKKKKRGLAELTQQNIALQNQLARLKGTAGPLPAEGATSPEPLSRLMQPDAAEDALKERDSQD